MQDRYHVPVLGREVTRYLAKNPHGVYLDGTLGGGGHAELLLNSLESDAHYIGIDRDAEAIEFARKRLSAFQNITFFQGTFTQMREAVRRAGFETVDAILLDLGVSSHQIDLDSRGFAFRPGVRLDMRMDREEMLTAAEILNSYDEKDLRRIFRQFGEERHAGRIARRVIAERQKQPIEFSDQLMRIIDDCVDSRFATKSYARIFQALRIEVNRELNELKNALSIALELLVGGGRLAVISYHSLEDREVKNFFKHQENPCTCPPELPYCVCEKKPLLKRIKPFLIRPGQDEIEQNPRARSAKLRIGEKI